MSKHSIEGLMKWISRDEWAGLYEAMLDAHLGPYLDSLSMDEDELALVIGIDAYNALWGCIFEDLLTHDMDDGRNIVADYLKRRGLRETASTKAYMNGLRHSVMSLYEVSDVRPGESFLLRDLIRGGEPVWVSERSASQQVVPGTHLAARVVPLPTRTVIGGGVLLFDLPTSEEVLRTFGRMRETLRSEMIKSVADGDAELVKTIDAATQDDTAMLALLAPMFTSAWLDHRLDAILGPSIERLSETDDDDLLFVSARYPFLPRVTVKAVRAALDACPDLLRDSANVWSWIDPDDAEDFEILGAVAIDGRAVVFDPDSATLDEGLQARIGQLLQGLVGEPEIITESVSDLLDNSELDFLETNLSPEDEKAANDHLYRALLAHPIPVLGDKTPIEAAKIKACRRKVATWLQFLEDNKTDPTDVYDFGWMWDELGVADLRR